MKPSNPDLSVIVLNYNSGTYLNSCLESISKSSLGKYLVEVITVDNCSTDNSFNLAKSGKYSNQNINFIFIKAEKNNGFAAGNNFGLKKVSLSSRYVLFLNPDTTIDPDTLKGMVDFFNENPKVDAATCSITLAATGKMQPECHRGFPTPWRSFCYFSGLSKLFPNSKIFSGYFLGHLNKDSIHEVEACVGAFLMVKRNVGNKIGWWNEKYFFYGEDLDFCYKLKHNKYRLFFNPNYKITHFQGISSGIKPGTIKISQANRLTKIRSAHASTQAMRIFYKENLLKNYPFPLRILVMFGIKLLEIQRLIRAKYL
jgi:GT2 family glycosyltransferase